jgi:hypothetical protein
MDPPLIDGETLTIENVHRVAVDRRRVALHPDAAKKMARGRIKPDFGRPEEVRRKYR